ncbi:MAG: ABC transporter permease [Bacteroidales bacterium]|nr:ABC transporter permease [Bacteroidales bacterium]
MKLSKINLIIGREYSSRVKKKSFILTTLLTPILFAAMMVIPVLIAIWGDNSQKKIIISDKSGIMTPYFENNEGYIYQFDNDTDIEALKKVFNSLDCYAILDISAIEDNGKIAVAAYSKEPLSMNVRSEVEHNLTNAIRDYKIKGYGLDNLESILDDINTKVEVESITLKEGGAEKKESVEIYMGLSYMMSLLIYMFVLIFGNMVMRGVIEEKSSRIVEVIVSSVNSFELMMGKIIGVALVALTQFAIWIIVTGILVTGVFGIAGESLAEKSAAATQMAMTDLSTVNTDAMGVTVPTSSASSIEQLFPSVAEGFAQLNIPLILISFLLYFILGYLLYASMFAAVGSAADNEADTNQLSLPVTLPMIIGLFIMISSFQAPNSSLSVWASIIPFTSPMVMMARIPFGTVPFWELALSIGILALTFVAFTYLSAKIYKIGILTYGKKTTWKDLFKWLKYKD